jgi:hypothetical protein
MRARHAYRFGRARKKKELPVTCPPPFRGQPAPTRAGPQVHLVRNPVG